MFNKKTLVALLVSALSLFGADFKEDTNYQTLKNPIANAKGTLIKVYSYDCPFCYKYDKGVVTPVVEKSGVVFEPWHLSTKAKYGKAGTNLVAIALATDAKAGKKPLDKTSLFYQVKMAYYKAYHDKKQRWDAGEDSFLEEGLKILGLDKAAYEAQAATPEVQAYITRWEPSLEIAKIQGVPAFVVDGKYLIMTAKITSRDYMVDLIKFLQSK